jgi:hypothetical protein
VNAHTTQQAKDTEPSRSHSEPFVRKKIIFVRKEIYFRVDTNYFSCGRKSQQERKTYNQLKDNELTSPSSGMQFTPIHPAPTDKKFPIFALRKRKRVPQNKLGTPLHIHSFPQEGGMIL